MPLRVRAFPLTLGVEQMCDLPAGAELLSAAMAPYGFAYLYALVDEAEPTRLRRIYVAQEGDPLPPHDRPRFVASFTQPVPEQSSRVWHVFELLREGG